MNYVIKNAEGKYVHRGLVVGGYPDTVDHWSQASVWSNKETASTYMERWRSCAIKTQWMLISVELHEIGVVDSYIPSKNKCVHTEHCCVMHGCKYADDDCPVELRKEKQSHPCEECMDMY